MTSTLTARPDVAPATDGPRVTPSSVDNALLLMAALHDRGSLRVSEAAELLGVAASTAHRLLNRLKDHGYADQDHQRVYRGALRGPHDITQRLDVRAAQPHLDELARHTRATVHLAVREGNGARLVASSPVHGRAHVGPREGWLLPAHVSSQGKVLLAELPEEDLRELYPLGVPATQRERACSLVELRRRLDSTRRRGWAADCEESEAGVVSIAVAVRDRSGAAVAAISLTARAASMELPVLTTFLPSLRAAAEHVGREWGRGDLLPR